MTPVALSDIEAAEKRIGSYIRQTPFFQFDFLCNADRQIWIKAELLQRTGSFKLRGAANCVLSNLAQAKKAGVVAASAEITRKAWQKFAVN